MRLGLVILNRNEVTGLRVLLPALRAAPVDGCFAVDGGSTDGSRELLLEAGIALVPEVSRGRGEAFRLAFAHARGKYDALIFFGPDGNEDPADLGRFRPLLEGGAQMVVARRMGPGARNEEDDARLRPRKWANQLFARAAYVTWGRGQPRLQDPINGYRAITLAAWDQLQPDGAGYTIEYQCSIRAYKLGLKVAEFPTREGPRLGGTSGAGAVPTGLRFVRLFVTELVG